jgi:outer membrane protein assembly factor BamB
MHEPVVADHKIFVGSSTPPPGLYVFNESSGSLIWSFQTPSSDFTSVVSIANGMVFAGIGNTFYAFGPLGTDLNRDGKVNIVDISIVARAFGSREGDPNWNVIADLNKDGIVNILDIAAVAKDYGKTT